MTCRKVSRQACISIHALRGEGDAHLSAHREMRQIFQSTPSVGRATALPSVTFGRK